MLLFWASVTSMFLNLEVDYHCSLWPKRIYPTPWNIPSLSRTTCCACFSFTSLAFLLSLLVIYFCFHELLILECAKRKRKSLWTFSLSELFIQFHVFKYHPLAVKSNFSCVSLFTWPLRVDVLKASLRCPIWTCEHLNPCIHSPQSHCFQSCQFIGMPFLIVVQSKILRVFINSSTLSTIF